MFHSNQESGVRAMPTVKCFQRVSNIYCSGVCGIQILNGIQLKTPLKTLTLRRLKLSLPCARNVRK